MIENKAKNATPSETVYPPTTYIEKIQNYLRKNKFVTVTIVGLLILLASAIITVMINANNFKNEKAILISNYEQKLDSLNIDGMKLTAKTFSWAMRSELMRNNQDQINQFFIEFVKTPGIIKLQFVNANNNLVEISTDKKDEGLETTEYKDIIDQSVTVDSINYKICTPIIGLNKRIGLFILHASKN